MLSDVVDLILPRECVGCGRDGVAWCAPCAATSWDPGELVVATLRVRAAAVYTGPVRAAVLAYKERGRRDLARPLGRLLSALLDGDPGTVLVPVPSTRRAARARGGEHVRRLAQLGARPGGHRVAAALRFDRPVTDSVGLSPAERSRNVAGAMRARAPGPWRQAVVVDDIVTTGATLAEAARALRAAAWDVRGAVVIARAELSS